MGKCLNGNTLAAVNGHFASVEGVSHVQERCGCGSAYNGDELLKI
jgi:hypothetical protein